MKQYTTGIKLAMLYVRFVA